MALEYGLKVWRVIGVNNILHSLPSSVDVAVTLCMGWVHQAYGAVISSVRVSYKFAQGGLCLWQCLRVTILVLSLHVILSLLLVRGMVYVQLTSLFPC